MFYEKENAIRDYALDCGFYNQNLQGLFSNFASQTGILDLRPLDLKWTAQIGSGRTSGGALAETVSRRRSAAAPWPEIANSRYRALFR
jgi:hypothetical protein